MKIKNTSMSMFRKRYFLIVIAFVLATFFSLKHHGIMDKIEDSCYGSNSKVALKNLLPFKWDTLYIVYGPQNSDDFYRNNQLTGKRNITKQDEISLYFILNNTVAYIENNSNHSKFRFGLSLLDAPYIEFQNRQPISEKMKENGVIAIYKYETVLIFPSFDPLFDPCAPTPADPLK